MPAFDASEHRASTGRTDDCSLPIPLRQFNRCNAGAVHQGPWRPPYSLHSPTSSSICHLSSLDRYTASFCSLGRTTRPTVRSLTSVGPECSPVFFREHVRIEVSYPLLALLRDLQIAECIADKGTDRLPEESGVRCSQIIRSLISELLARAGFLKFCKQRRRLAQIINVGQLADQVRGTKQAWII